MLFHFACEAMGAASIRLSLRPLNFQGHGVNGNLARERRDRETVPWRAAAV
jgi:hypothetical protein